MNKDNYIGICPSCGRIEWLELEEDGYGNENSGKVNYLRSDGTIFKPNSYVRLKKKDYIDLVCSMCECPVTIIPFEACDLEQRKKVFLMSESQRIRFAERFELLDALEEDTGNGNGDDYYA